MLVDSHCHLDADSFDNEREAILSRAKAAGIVVQVVPATTAKRWPKLRDVCAMDHSLHAVYGLHPMFIAEHCPTDLHQLRQWIEQEKPCALGECGLDFFVVDPDISAQLFYFEQQLLLAREFDLPLIIHARRAQEPVNQCLRRIKGLRGVIHSFSGSVEQARQLWKMGFFIGLGGPITWPRARRLRALVATMPLEFLLLETDAPDQPDSHIAGQRNEPARVAVIAQTVADLRQQSVTDIAAQTTANAQRLFNFTPTLCS